MAKPAPRLITPAEVPPIMVEAHDRQQIEIELAHDLSWAQEQEQAFSFDLFCFIPRNVGVTAANYPRDEFYGDLTTFLRVDLPGVTLEELAHGAFSPLVRLRHYIEAIRRGDATGEPLMVEVKLFGHIFTESVRRRVADLHGALAGLAGQPISRRWEFLDEVDRFAETARAALAALRGVGRSCEPLGQAAPPVLQVFRYTDEYSSLFFDGALALLAEAATTEHELFDGSGFVRRLRHTLARHARREAEYREALGYLNLTDQKGGNAEYFAFRQSFLKKAVQQALYVDTRRLTNEDRFVRNATGAVAAGLAATWALVAQLPAQLKDLTPIMQTMLLGVPVVAYIAKDRIKELTREWLSRRVRAFDTSSEIAVGSLGEAGLGSLAGRVRERVSYPELAQVPPEVLGVRLAHRTVHGAGLGAEGVLLYSRHLMVRSASTGQGPVALPQRMGLRQIIRLNLRHFLTRLDEPTQLACHYSTVEERFLAASLPKVYHLNLIARVAQGEKSMLRRWRVILSKKGIVRIEEVGPDP